MLKAVYCSGFGENTQLYSVHGDIQSTDLMQHIQACYH